MNPQLDLQRALENASRALQQGQADTAVAILEGLADTQPNHPDRLHLLALARKATGNLAGADAAFRAALAQQPGHPVLLNNFANLLRQTGNSTQAEQAYRQAISRQPRYADALKNLGILLAEQRRPEEACQVLERACRLPEADAGAWSTLGNTLSQLEAHEAAVDAFQTALRKTPGHISAFVGLAHALRVLGRMDEAQQVLDKALQLAPAAAAVLTARAHLAVDRGHLEVAEATYRDVLARVPAHVDAHTHLNELLWQRGRNDEYGRSFTAALRVEPDNVALLAGYCRSLAAVGGHHQVREVLDANASLVDGEPQLLAARARAEAATGDPGAAMKTFRSALPLAPGQLELDYAQLAIVQAEYGLAMSLLDDVAHHHPDDQLMWACRGLCWSLTDDPRSTWLQEDYRYVQTYELPCPPGYTSLDDFLEALQARLLTLHGMQHAPTSQTLVGGTQTPGLLLQRPEPEIRDFKAALTQVVERYLATFARDDDHPLLRRRRSAFRFAGSWSVALRSGGFHVNHVHPAGWISSAFYVHVPQDLGTTEADPRGWLQFGESGLGLGDREHVEMRVRPRAGYLTLFPSYTWHGTVPFESSELRITAPFDVVPA